MYILLSPCHEEYVPYARLLLNYFVKRYKGIYGIQWLTHNVHTLVIAIAIAAIIALLFYFSNRRLLFIVNNSSDC